MTKQQKRRLLFLVLIAAILICLVIFSQKKTESFPIEDGTPPSSNPTTQLTEITGPTNTPIDNDVHLIDIGTTPTATAAPTTYTGAGPSLKDVPSISEYDGVHGWVMVNNSQPYFDKADLTRTDAFEMYSDLDSLGRCGPAYANICRELMPTEKRESISQVKPSGWIQASYTRTNDKGKVVEYNLYNRCHLIGFQLAGENANEKNLITGTDYMNHDDGMLGFENMVADYVKENDNHVLYRVTPVFKGDNLVADGVLMEAWSVEDEGDGICLCIFVFNIQPGITIDYKTGASYDNDNPVNDVAMDYVLNINSHTFHLPSCDSAINMNPKNKAEVHATRTELIAEGYKPCGACHP